MNISVNELAAEMTKILEAYQDATEESVYNGTKKTADEVVQKLRTETPAGAGVYREWGEYQSGWAPNISRKRKGVISGVVWNPKHYQLTHLLEFGHRVVNAKNKTKSKAFPHIAPVAEWAQNAYLNNLKKEIDK